MRGRRQSDLATHRELVFLARSMDAIAGPGSAEERLAEILQLVADVAGARRAAILADGNERRLAVSLRVNEDPGDAEALATWLDARAPRSRADRAGSAPGIVSLAMLSGDAAPDEPDPADAADPDDTAESGGATADAMTFVSPFTASFGGTDAESETDAAHQPARDDRRYGWMEIPGNTTVVLGFDFGDADVAAGWQDRFSAPLARHAGVAMAIIADELSTDRELELLRAHDAHRTRFVSTIVHELRTPLTGLGGYLELIESGAVTDHAIEREFIERSREIVTSMEDLVGDLLELSRIESGGLSLEVDAFSVAEICERVLDHLTPIAIQRSVHLSSKLPPRLQAATGDRRRVEQILKNLLGNALKFTPPGGSVELVGWFDGPVAVMAVRDDGIGIASEDRPRIFERFYRMASHERINGTGLGLPIARELARAMGGELDVASVQRAGSSFVLVLPGPTAAGSEVIADALDRALSAEETHLEDQGILRRLQLLGRGTTPRRPAAATEGHDRRGHPERHESPARRRLKSIEGGPPGAKVERSQPVRLRSIEGSLHDPLPSA